MVIDGFEGEQGWNLESNRGLELGGGSEVPQESPKVQWKPRGNRKGWLMGNSQTWHEQPRGRLRVPRRKFSSGCHRPRRGSWGWRPVSWDNHRGEQQP